MLWFTTRQLKSRNADARRKAAFKLGASRKVGAVPALSAALSDGDWGVRHAAVEALGRIGDPRAGEPLVAALRDKDWTVRSAAAAALMNVGDARSVEPLIAALKAPDEFVRSSAVVALGKIGGRRASQAVASMLRDEDPGVLEQTVKALTTLGWRPASPAERAWLVVARKEWDAVAGLGAVAVQPLSVALERSMKKGGGGWAVGVEVARLLGAAGDARAVSALTTCLPTAEDPVAKIIALSLGQLGDAEAVAPLIEALGRRNPEVRAMVMASLATFGDAVVEPALYAIENRKQQRPDVIDAVVALLSRVGDERVVEPLIRLTAIPRFATVAGASLKSVMDRLGMSMSADEMARLAEVTTTSRQGVPGEVAAGAPDDQAAWQVA